MNTFVYCHYYSRKSRTQKVEVCAYSLPLSLSLSLSLSLPPSYYSAPRQTSFSMVNKAATRDQCQYLQQLLFLWLQEEDQGHTLKYRKLLKSILKERNRKSQWMINLYILRKRKHSCELSLICFIHSLRVIESCIQNKLCL